MTKKKNKIAYLAPEIPALSATFVYEEIIELEKKGFTVFPISIHLPKELAQESHTEDLALNTFYLYDLSKMVFLWANIIHLIKKPLLYLRTCLAVLSDAFKSGILSRTGLGLIYRFFVSSHLALIIAQKGCTHLHSNFAHIPTDIAMYTSKLSGVPFSFTSHANDLFERGWLLKEKVERAVFSVTISDFNRRFLIKQGADPKKIHVIHCGVDMKPTIRPLLKHDNGLIKMGTLGRLVEKKGVDILIKSADILKKNRLNFRLEIGGDGPLKDDLQDMVANLNLSNEIMFLGAIPHNMVDKWLESLDIFVLACKKDQQGDMDGIPVVLMEAMKVGIPVVSTKISGIPELITQGESGFLAEPDDPENLALVIQRIISHEDNMNEIVKNGIRKIKTEFNRSYNSSLLSNLFMRLEA